MIATLRRHHQSGISNVVRYAVGLCWLTAVGYVLLALGILGAGDLEPEPGAVGVVFTAAACYALGGSLIALRRRWLWIAGAVMNALVLLMFFNLYSARPSVLLSGGALATKSAQILLELALLALIVRRR